jgi:hypothetical protein
MSNTYTIANTTMIGTTSGFNGTSYGIGISTTPYTLSNGNGYSMSPNVTIKNEPPSLEVKGKMILNGQDLENRLKTIEDVLQIPERNAILEKKYPKLKKMYDEYIKELSKCEMWESLKGKE